VRDEADFATDPDGPDDPDDPTGRYASRWAVQGVPEDAQRMGLDRHTVEGSLLAMAGTLDGARWTHRAVAWLLLLVFVSPLVLTALRGLGWW
jgi:hypothetical protein